MRIFSNKYVVTQILGILFVLIWVLGCQKGQEKAMKISDKQVNKTIQLLVEKHGEEQRSRIETGVKQVAALWQAEDGSADEFNDFCLEQFITDSAMLKKTFERLEYAFEEINGHFVELGRELKWHLEIDTGEILPVDYMLGEFAPWAHSTDEMFKTKIAFLVLLNFPAHTLEQRLKDGPNWSREEWAQDRLVKMFGARVPGDIQSKIQQVYLAAENYVAEYNIFMHNLLTEDGQRLFPEGLKLISHWGLRDELKSHYANAAGLVKQQMIFQVMERIVRQEIPEIVINNPEVDWKPGSNEVLADNGKINAEAEATRRFQHLLDVFHAVRAADPYHPTAPTMIDRKFNQEREIPEEKVEALFTGLLNDPVIREIAQLIEKRLGRPLQPFDIWYDGFKSRSAISETKLDQIVGQKYPTVTAFKSDLPNILTRLGFDYKTATFLSSKIEVDPSRGAGHAMGAGRRSDNAHLRTRIPDTGMKYKGYNIAIHEFGHNVEQVFSLNKVDHYFLNGVPNNAFTEAFAFTFQSRDLDLLGIETKDPQAKHLKTLDQIWSTYEIAGVSLVDMAVWRWMYQNPEASAAELRDAVNQIAINVWNQFYAPVLGHRDTPLLAIYSHMIAYGLYLPDYAIGHIIDFQIEEYMKGKNLATEMERMCRQGALTPDFWMQQAVGAPILAAPMIEAAKVALQNIK